MEVGHHQGMMENLYINVDNNSWEKVRSFKYLGSLFANQNSIPRGALLSSRLDSNNLKIKIYKIIIRAFPVVLHGYEKLGQLIRFVTSGGFFFLNYKSINVWEYTVKGRTNPVPCIDT